MESILLVRCLVFAALALLMQGCAAVAPIASTLTGFSPGASLQIHSQTEVKLDQGNFVLIRTNVVGSSKGFKLLGFITIVPATLDKAMNRLYAESEAKHGHPQTLAHLIVEHSAVNVILFTIPKVTARADLVEFLPRTTNVDAGVPSGLRAESNISFVGSASTAPWGNSQASPQQPPPKSPAAAPF